jgi:hypothetical protein
MSWGAGELYPLRGSEIATISQRHPQKDHTICAPPDSDWLKECDSEPAGGTTNLVFGGSANIRTMNASCASAGEAPRRVYYQASLDSAASLPPGSTLPFGQGAFCWKLCECGRLSQLLPAAVPFDADSQMKRLCRLRCGQLLADLKRPTPSAA